MKNVVVKVPKIFVLVPVYILLVVFFLSSLRCSCMHPRSTRRLWFLLHEMTFHVHITLCYSEMFYKSRHVSSYVVSADHDSMSRVPQYGTVNPKYFCEMFIVEMRDLDR
ncbi:hypothetical protein BKA82DRAFT_4122667 [Pisolithus tinctorius]|nr:hypothetical protein BKA82DRAFT_4122667 [Pisolithus tinctorius]